ncbi:peroxisomal 2 4-dienoyl-CoA reductase sps19 [Tilletia horrida]|uniref:2,4-dienoyl-CoA reductase [(3E)-enoyl-CoA-producing] n=1 Tax=Tilletia horrida TaxID=155126 RepID=A0AAN6JN88_9BASI|nr:peroxisomal 2 4-dienoyl-CoA reductase sps19 [Tilletia horrida]KAK0540094.1 peroxisomal 2 4-dienoyl-CoA reductase sps19 [Tilletia horrida]KAK0541542.1 peroxisomal 2 4-dienoyl-CoA reductase sps19 [Tilletia horrida]KAK0562034.1 peroxisomal 2 4-dienoyl-CoA reductase sps19 [Tilletia horrida]
MTDPVVLSAVPSTDIFKDDIFKGKVLFCTGGGSGICYKVVESIMKHGADAAIVGRKADRLTAAAKELEKTVPGRKCIATPGDVRKFDDLVAAVKKTVETYGRIDFVIAGAAGNFLAPIEGISSNGFRTVQEIDLVGTYNTIKATVDELKKSHGSYIHISATLHYYGLAWQAPASAAKAGIDALSAVTAVELGPWGIRSNTIAPGPIAGTEGLERLAPKGTEEAMAGMIPMQRVGTKDDIANAAVFLFSPAASYITGTRLVVDGAAWQTQGAWLPYPDSVLDPKSLRDVINGSKL